VKAEDIRNLKHDTTNVYYRDIVVFLQEIAAQLAELNEKIGDLGVTVYKP